MKFGISISTFSNFETPRERFNIIKKCLDSLKNSKELYGEDVYINIVCDTGIEVHLDFLKKYPFHLIVNKKNMGISYTKNVGIQSILNQGCYYGFLLDDDVIINNLNIFEKYITAMNITKFHHFCYSFYKYDNNVCKKVKINNFEILQTPHVSGLLLTFSKDSIKKTGYFEKFPYKYGHEHSNFSLKNITQNVSKFFCDVVDEDHMINHNYVNHFPTVRNTTGWNQKLFNKNGQLLHSNLGKICDFSIDTEITNL